MPACRACCRAVNGCCIEQAVRTGPRAAGADQPALGVRAQELLLPRPAQRLPDLAVRSSRSSAAASSPSTCPTARAKDIGITRLHLEMDAGKSLHDQRPDATPDRPQPLGRGADGDRLRARHPLGRGGGALHAQAALDPALSRHLRRQHGGGLAALRRQRLGAPRRATALGTRCEIKNLNSMRFVGRAIEYEAQAPGRDPRGGRRDRAGDPAVRCRARARPARCAPRRRRTTTAISPTPTCCRSSSRRPSSSGSRPSCPSCPTPRRRASSRDYGLSAYDAEVLVAERATADYFEAAARGPRRQAGRQLGDQRAVRRARTGPAGTSSTRRSRPSGLGKLVDLIAGRHDLAAGSPRTCSPIMFETGERPGGDRRASAACSRSPIPARSSRSSTS